MRPLVTLRRLALAAAAVVAPGRAGLRLRRRAVRRPDRRQPAAAVPLRLPRQPAGRGDRHRAGHRRDAAGHRLPATLGRLYALGSHQPALHRQPGHRRRHRRSARRRSPAAQRRHVRLRARHLDQPGPLVLRHEPEPAHLGPQRPDRRVDHAVHLRPGRPGRGHHAGRCRALAYSAPPTRQRRPGRRCTRSTPPATRSSPPPRSRRRSARSATWASTPTAPPRCVITSGGTALAALRSHRRRQSRALRRRPVDRHGDAGVQRREPGDDRLPHAPRARRATRRSSRWPTSAPRPTTRPSRASWSPPRPTRRRRRCAGAACRSRPRCSEACIVSGVLKVGRKRQTAVTGAVLATAGWVHAARQAELVDEVAAAQGPDAGLLAEGHGHRRRRQHRTSVPPTAPTRG